MYPVYLIICSHPSYGQYLMPYVGVVTSDRTIEDRFYRHCKSPSDSGAPYLFRAIRKHGKEWFQIEQIDAGNTPEQALELEKWWIARLGTMAPDGGYNLTKGGAGGNTVSPSEETRLAVRAKHSASIKARWQDPEYRKKQHEARVAAWSSPERREKQAVKSRGNKHGCGHAPWNKGKKHPWGSNGGSFTKGLVPWNKGMRCPGAVNSGSFSSSHLKAQWADPEFREWMLAARQNSKDGNRQ